MPNPDKSIRTDEEKVRHSIVAAQLRARRTDATPEMVFCEAETVLFEGWYRDLRPRGIEPGARRFFWELDYIGWHLSGELSRPLAVKSSSVLDTI